MWKSVGPMLIDVAEILTDEGEKRFRPMEVIVDLRKDGSFVGRAPHPIAFIDENGKEVPLGGYDRGHVVARQFIGKDADDPRNVVPLDPTFNRSGLWKALELALVKLVRDGADIHFEVKLEYTGESPLIPSCLIVNARDMDTLTQCSINGSKAKNLRLVPPDIQPVQMSRDELDGEYGSTLVQYIIDLDVWFATNIDLKTYDIGKQSFLVGANLGPFGFSRPYQCLDFAFALDEVNAVNKYCGKKMPITNGLIFNRKQRDLVQLTNRLRNNGWLVSDQPDDPGGAHLTVGSGANAGHVDHIYPKAQAGANAFSNARLISRAWNEKTKDQHK